MWLAFLHHATKLGVGKNLDIGTQFVAQAQLALLQAVGGDPAHDVRRPMAPESSKMKAAVESSGFAESLTLGAKPAEPDDKADAKATRRWLRQTRYK